MARKNVLSILRENHEIMRELLSELDRTGDRSIKRRRELLGDIAAEMDMHGRLEEEIFYPPIRDAASTKEERLLVTLALEQHRLVESLLSEMADCPPESETFTARAKILSEVLEKHMADEERHLFPRARQVLGSARLQQLAHAMEERKLELLTRAS